MNEIPNRRLVVRAVPGSGPGGVILAVIDADSGHRLAKQRAVRIEQRYGEPTTVTVEFIVNGTDFAIDLTGIGF